MVDTALKLPQESDPSPINHRDPANNLWSAAYLDSIPVPNAGDTLAGIGNGIYRTGVPLALGLLFREGNISPRAYGNNLLRGPALPIAMANTLISATGEMYAAPLREEARHLELVLPSGERTRVVADIDKRFAPTFSDRFASLFEDGSRGALLGLALRAGGTRNPWALTLAVAYTGLNQLFGDSKFMEASRLQHRIDELKRIRV